MIKSYSTVSELARDYGVSTQLAQYWKGNGNVVEIQHGDFVLFTTLEQLVSNIPVKHKRKKHE